jgi:DNA-binding transcriptional LysR family regulator
MIPSPTEIDYFIEIYHTGHISRAALRLGVTQPTLTQSLQRLEEKINALLFHRTKKGVIPTRDAVLLYRRAQALKDCWSELQEGLKRSGQALEGRFAVGCHPSVGAYTLPLLLDALESLAPLIDVKLVHDSSRKITDGLVSYQIDLGYVVNPSRHRDLVLRKIGNDRVTFWKAIGRHPMPRKIFADRSREQVEKLLGRAFRKHFHDWSVISCSSLELVRTLVRLGHGVGILPERVAHAEGRCLEIYDPDLPSQSDEIYLAYRREVLASQAGQALLKCASFQLPAP